MIGFSRNEMPGFCNNKNSNSQLQQTPNPSVITLNYYRGFSKLKGTVVTGYMCSEVLAGQATSFHIKEIIHSIIQIVIMYLHLLFQTYITHLFFQGSKSTQKPYKSGPYDYSKFSETIQLCMKK